MGSSTSRLPRVVPVIFARWGKTAMMQTRLLSSRFPDRRTFAVGRGRCTSRKGASLTRSFNWCNFYNLRKLVCSVSNCPRKTQLRHVMGEHAVDIVQLSASRSLLCLNHLDSLRDFGFQFLLSEVEILPGNLDISPGDIHLFSRCAEIQNGTSNVRLDT